MRQRIRPSAPTNAPRGLSLAERLPMRSMTRMWQMLLKALEEVAAAPNAMMAAEMAVIRLTHVSELPSPEELVKRLKDAPRPPEPPQGGGGGGVAAPMPRRVRPVAVPRPMARPAPPVAAAVAPRVTPCWLRRSSRRWRATRPSIT